MYLLKKVWDELIIWLDTNGIKETEYQFGCFNGPNSIKILNKALQLKDILPIELKKFADALNLLNEVRIHCFGQKLLPDYENKIKLFEKAYRVEHQTLPVEFLLNFYCMLQDMNLKIGTDNPQVLSYGKM